MTDNSKKRRKYTYILCVAVTWLWLFGSILLTEYMPRTTATVLAALFTFVIVVVRQRRDSLGEQFKVWLLATAIAFISLNIFSILVIFLMYPISGLIYYLKR